MVWTVTVVCLSLFDTVSRHKIITCQIVNTKGMLRFFACLQLTLRTAINIERKNEITSQFSTFRWPDCTWIRPKLFMSPCRCFTVTMDYVCDEVISFWNMIWTTGLWLLFRDTGGLFCCIKNHRWLLGKKPAASHPAPLPPTPTALTRNI